MKEKYLLIVVLVMALFLSLNVAFGQTTTYPQPSEYGPGVMNWGPNAKYGGTLKVINANGPETDDFNPFSPSGNVPFAYIYESLFYENSLNDGITYLLGTSYKWTDNNTELDVAIRKDVKWSDGISFTPKDVAFTFNYLKAHPSIDLNGVWSPANDLASVSASGNTVIFKMSKPNVAIFPYISGQFIIPEHIWANITAPSKYTDSNPVGTGPFLFKSFDSAANTFTFVKNQNYWMKGRPYLDGIVYTSTNSDTTCELYLLKHKYDASNLFISGIKKVFVDKDPSVNKYWWPITTGYGLEINDVKYPFNIPEFRQALSMALNRTFINASWNMPTVDLNLNPTMIVQPSWIDPTLTSLTSSLTTYDPQRAQDLLASIGFKKNANGLLTGPNGKVLPSYSLVCPEGWNPLPQLISIIASELKQMGLQVNAHTVTSGFYYSSMETGTFDMTMYYLPVGFPNPYYTYYNYFSPSTTAPIGKNAVSNFSRYTNPLITDALHVFASTSDPRLQRQAMYTIERIILDDMPYIALSGSVMFETYQTTTFTGFPNAQNPYWIGSTFPVSELVALNTHLK